ncbi:GyrI-like domain-containing protein [Alkalihalobacillus sp. TS-13]|uniref:GyrI-like domain-containing protein n=1 Tax=Alkalihalobacillus sp. TS-13 TaxID=2842455 RepID=UPI001C877058|nr:GyrI-like domain-containing protein [Alkalihalobacillus sp. TS-13]
MSEGIETKVSAIEILDLPEFKLVGMSCSTTMAERHEKIPAMVHDFYENHIHKIKNRINEPVSYGLFVDPPNWNPDTEEFTWIAAVEVSHFDNIPEEMISKVIPARKYATLRFDPTTDNFDPYPYLHEWIQNQGLKQIDNFGFELFLPYKGVDSKFILHLPVK